MILTSPSVGPAHGSIVSWYRLPSEVCSSLMFLAAVDDSPSSRIYSRCPKRQVLIAVELELGQELGTRGGVRLSLSSGWNRTSDGVTAGTDWVTSGPGSTAARPRPETAVAGPPAAPREARRRRPTAGRCRDEPPARRPHPCPSATAAGSPSPALDEAARGRCSWDTVTSVAAVCGSRTGWLEQLPAQLPRAHGTQAGSCRQPRSRAAGVPAVWVSA